MHYEKLITLTFIAMLWCANANAYVSCQDISVKVSSAISPTFHNFSEVGITGSTLFIKIPNTSCTNSTGDALSSTLYLVIGDIEKPDELKKLWLSMLLSAEARNKTIKFHAIDKGKNSKGTQVIVPYYLGVD